ncbi:hypothetical protein, partial [Mycobacterium avium]
GPTTLRRITHTQCHPELAEHRCTQRSETGERRYQRHASGKHPRIDSSRELIDRRIFTPADVAAQPV